MHIHFLGIGGTFMSALALLAKEAGFTVSGSDVNCYPPVSDLLKAHDIQWTEGYDDCTLALKADQIVIGNAMKRGMPVIEAILDARKDYISGPEWLAQKVLSQYRVIAIAGTHGKTTTTSMLAFILQEAGLEPGFLIGGVASNLKTSACLGKGKWFVIEADEYDTAFFDKRPKFMHYRPEVAILNNLEFDHADIYTDLAAIQQQFHYFLRTLPAKGLVLKPQHDNAINAVLEQGCFSRVENLSLGDNGEWRAELKDETGQFFSVYHQGKWVAEVNWSLIGKFNVENALAAIAASHYAGVAPAVAAKALTGFIPVKRRLEVKSNHHGVTVYDDFAHHPTAIQKTLEALQQSKRHQRVFIILEFASYTMRTGVHAKTIGPALSGAQEVYILNPDHFNLDEQTKNWTFSYKVLPTVAEIVSAVTNKVKPGDALLVMSNRSFGNIYGLLSEAIAYKFKVAV